MAAGPTIIAGFCHWQVTMVDGALYQVIVAISEPCKHTRMDSTYATSSYPYFPHFTVCYGCHWRIVVVRFLSFFLGSRQ